MVKFGDRMRGMIQAGWEERYIDYSKLKKLIEVNEPDALTAAQSETFFEALQRDIRKVDAFVEKQGAALKARAATKRGIDREDVVADLAILRRYVGTNIIAATKIIKKHDKHVDPTLRKRERVAALIRACPGMNSLPQFQSELGAAPPSPSVVAVDMNEFTNARDEDDEDDTRDSEDSLRSLPGWLLGGAKQDAAIFFKAYLADWRLESDDEENQPILILSRGATSKPKGDASEWDANFADDTRAWSELSPKEKAVALCVVTAKLSLILLALCERARSFTPPPRALVPPALLRSHAVFALALVSQTPSSAASPSSRTASASSAAGRRGRSSPTTSCSPTPSRGC